MPDLGCARVRTFVTAKDRAEANAKAIAGQLDKPWESLDDVGGFYEPEPFL